MGVRVVHSIGDLERDLTTMARKAPSVLKAVVRKNTIEGNRLAKTSAAKQHTMSSRYDIHYSRSFTWDVNSYYLGGAGGNIIGEYGPTVGRPQAEMSFERGSRNSPGHHDLKKSADVIAWTFGPNVLHAAAGLFWPES